MANTTAQDTALDLLHGELKGKTPAQIRKRSLELLRDGKITREVLDHIQDVIRRRGVY